jgi:hypothetical protein
MGAAGRGRHRGAGDVRSAAGETCNRVCGCEMRCIDRKSEDKQPPTDSARISKLYSPLHRPHGHVVSDHSDGRARRRQDGLSW